MSNPTLSYFFSLMGLATFTVCIAIGVSMLIDGQKAQPSSSRNNTNTTLSTNEKNGEQIEINCAFPIGNWCVCAYQLAKHNLRFRSSPLDWIGARYPSYRPYSLDTVIHLFETKCKDFFEEAKIVSYRTCRGCIDVMDTKNNLESVHHFREEQSRESFEEEKRRVRQETIRRAKIVDEIMSNSDSIALVSCRDDSKEAFIDFIKKFSKIYSGKKIYLINVRNTYSKKVSCEILYDKDNLKIIEYRFLTRGKYDWRGNDKGWDEALKSLKLVRK